MASGFYNHFFHEEGREVYNLDSDVIKVALVTNSYSFDRDSDTSFTTHIQPNESSGTGYTAGGATLTKTWTKDNVNDKALFDGNDVTWSGSSVTARGAVIYDDTASGKPPILYIDFGADKTTSGTDFKISWNASGIFDKSEV